MVDYSRSGYICLVGVDTRAMTRRKELNTVGVILVCAIIGIVFSIVVYTLNSQGIIIPALLDDVNITIENVMFIIFFIWLIIGVILGATLFAP